MKHRCFLIAAIFLVVVANLASCLGEPTFHHVNDDDTLEVLPLNRYQEIVTEYTLPWKYSKVKSQGYELDPKKYTPKESADFFANVKVINSTAIAIQKDKIKPVKVGKLYDLHFYLNVEYRNSEAEPWKEEKFANDFHVRFEEATPVDFQIKKKTGVEGIWTLDILKEDSQAIFYSVSWKCRNIYNDEMVFVHGETSSPISGLSFRLPEPEQDSEECYIKFFFTHSKKPRDLHRTIQLQKSTKTNDFINYGKDAKSINDLMVAAYSIKNTYFKPFRAQSSNWQKEYCSNRGFYHVDEYKDNVCACAKGFEGKRCNFPAGHEEQAKKSLINILDKLTEHFRPQKDAVHIVDLILKIEEVFDYRIMESALTAINLLSRQISISKDDKASLRLGAEIVVGTLKSIAHRKIEIEEEKAVRDSEGRIVKLLAEIAPNLKSYYGEPLAIQFEPRQVKSPKSDGPPKLKRSWSLRSLASKLKMM